MPETSNCAAVVEPEDSSEDGPTCVIGRGGRTFVLVQQCTLVVLLSALILCMATYYMKKWPPSDYWAQPSLYRWTPTCETAACNRQSKWLVSMISKQVNPCWETNAFVCDRTPLSRGSKLRVMQVRDGGTAVGNETVRISPHSKHLKQGASRTVPHWYYIPQTDQELQRACDIYAASREESMESVRKFMAQFNLDLASMQDDGDEDPLDRVLEVSLLFGLGALVQIRRRYDLISDPAKPFKLEVAVVDADQELFSIWSNISAAKWKSYYTSCLGDYGPNRGTSEHTQLVADLMAADREASELYRSANDPTDTNQTAFSLWSFEEVASVSKIPEETWLTRIRKHARAEYDASDGLITRTADLLVAGFVLRPDKRFAMRKLIAWHLLRTIVGPKHHCVDPYASAVAESYKKVPGIDTKCSGVTALTQTIQGRAIHLLIGLNSVTAEWLRKIMQLMARIQRAMALTVLGKGEVRTTDDDTSFASASFLEAGNGSNAAPMLDRLFARVKDLPKGFVFYWLGMLLAWHGLPPLLQAHMQAMSDTIDITWSVLAYMRPPYYYFDGLASYNYAVLGQASIPQQNIGFQLVLKM
ncbi:hypothetical protein HPB50_017814 [Hyalomma asiaticum]|uniref:Uncharacterized protein n=1 Tax=Hyalomma asiaticum TaxID=266040 RepID=A0ACB7SZJ5_HYAAI|nr:hypothetical protein HPB50_017814 [Hyalomma asiaticum]